MRYFPPWLISGPDDCVGFLCGLIGRGILSAKAALLWGEIGLLVVIPWTPGIPDPKDGDPVAIWDTDDLMVVVLAGFLLLEPDADEDDRSCLLFHTGVSITLAGVC